MQHPDEGRLHEYADGALAPADTAELERHLAACDACRAALGEVHTLLGESDRIVAKLQLDPPPARVATPPAARRPGRRFDPRVLGLAASALLVVGVGYMVVARRPSAIGITERAAEPAAAAAPAKELERGTAPAPAPAEAPPAIAAAPAPARPEAARTGVVRQRNDVSEESGEAKDLAASGAAADAAAPRATAAPMAPSALRKEAAPSDTPPAAARRRDEVELNDLPAFKPRVLQEAPAAGNVAAPRHGIEGLQAVSHEALPGGGTRSVYSVNGTRVELDQGPGTVPADRTRSSRYEVSWTTDGTLFTLRAALPPAEVEALRARVR